MGVSNTMTENNTKAPPSSSSNTNRPSYPFQNLIKSLLLSKPFKSEFQMQLSIATPSIIGLLLYKIPWLLSLHFVGILGSLELASASLAMTLCNVTGLSLSVGLSFALTTLTGQARGDLLLRGEYYLKKSSGWISIGSHEDDNDVHGGSSSRQKHFQGSDNQDDIVTFTNNRDQEEDISYDDDSNDEELLSLATTSNHENNVGNDDDDQIQISRKTDDEEEGIYDHESIDISFSHDDKFEMIMREESIPLLLQQQEVNIPNDSSQISTNTTPDNYGSTSPSPPIYSKSATSLSTFATKSTSFSSAPIPPPPPPPSPPPSSSQNTPKTNNVSSTANTTNTPLQPMVYLYRGLIIQLAFVIPVGLWWMNGVESLLLYLGQEPQIAQMTSVYLRVLTPGLWSYSIGWTLTSWLQCIEMADVPAYAAFLGFVLHVPFNILFVNVCGFGYLGVAMATVMFQFVQPIAMCIYLFGTTNGKERILVSTGAKGIGMNEFHVWTDLVAAVDSFSGIRIYLSLALPGIIIISEWWASEISIFLSGRLYPNPEYAVGSMSIYQSINTFCFMFPKGFSTAASSRVGMFLGKNDPDSAALASWVSVFGSGILSLLMSMMLYWTPHTLFPSFFTPDEDVVLETSHTIPFLAWYVFADGIQTTLSGIINGVGKQIIIMPVVIISYWIIALPFGYYNSFILNGGDMEDCGDSWTCGIVGLVFGMTTGTWMHFVLLIIIVMCMIDWKNEAYLTQKRLSEEKEERRRRATKMGLVVS